MTDATPLLGARVGLVATEAFDDPTGIGTYTRQLSARLATRIDQFFCVRNETRSAPAGDEQVFGMPLLLRAGRLRHVAAPYFFAARNFDLLHFPVETSMYWVRAKRTRVVVTVHGLASIRLPAELHERLPMRARVKYKRLLESADRIITVSESSKRDIVDVYDVPHDKITVVYNGIDEIFMDEQAARLPQDFDGRPFVLSVGATIPKKNISAVVRVLAALKERGLPHALIHVGPPGYAQEALESEVRRFNLRTDVIFKGYVTKEALAGYYRAADVLLFPSFHEGFGIPIVEAMASGCPVISSTAYSLPEVAGDAALLVDPYDVEALISVTHRLLSHSSLRDEMAELGRLRARRFSWNRCADETLAVYREVLGRG